MARPISRYAGSSPEREPRRPGDEERYRRDANLRPPLLFFKTGPLAIGAAVVFEVGEAVGMFIQSSVPGTGAAVSFGDDGMELFFVTGSTGQAFIRTAPYRRFTIRNGSGQAGVSFNITTSADPEFLMMVSP